MINNYYINTVCSLAKVHMIAYLVIHDRVDVIFYDNIDDRMSKSKQTYLRRTGTLNPRPDKVRDPQFEREEFFDARDLLQVRYELVRAASTGVPLAKVAERFGCSVPTCSRLKRAFHERGLFGLIRRRPGPRGPHKFTPEIVDFIVEYRRDHGPVGADKLVVLIADKFGVTVHPRGIYKILEKKTSSDTDDRLL